MLPKAIRSPIMARIIMADPIHVALRYAGPEVDAGEMDVNEVVGALQGFSGAYGKVAAEIAPEANYQLKVTAIREGSFDLFISAAIVVSATGPIETVKFIADAAKFAFRIVTDVIGLKKHTRGQQFTTHIDGVKGSVTIINADRIEMTVEMPAFEMFRQKLLDSDLAKITAPLSEGRIDEARLTEVEDQTGVSVSAAERPYFRESSTISKEPQTVVGTLVSLNKKTNRGTFEFGDGRTVRYHYIGREHDSFHADFAQKGSVRAIATVEFDENLVPVHMDIERVEARQIALPLTPSSDVSTST